MSAREAKLAELSARAERERTELAEAVRDLRDRIEEKRARWMSIGFWAGALATGATTAYRVFGRNSFSSKLTRWSSMASVAFGVLRLFGRLFRLL